MTDREQLVDWLSKIGVDYTVSLFDGGSIVETEYDSNSPYILVAFDKLGRAKVDGGFLVWG